jgi:hypothetical protein
MAIRLRSGFGVFLMAAAVGAPAGAAWADDCASAFNRIVPAFIRRLARDSGNVLGRDAEPVVLLTTMRLGVPSGTAAARRLEDKARRLWAHTENKIRRKCSDVEAAATYPGEGRNTFEVTDDLFNLYGLPWVAALRVLAAPYGSDCVRVTLVQSGYAARDQLRKGQDNWPQYSHLAERYCPGGMVGALPDIAAAYLSDLRRDPPP